MSRRSYFTAIFVTVAAIFQSPFAAAIDGEVLINDDKALQGGITPADTPGYPVTLDRAGRYKLTGVLLVPSGKNGIAVGASNVTIDLNGFGLFGGGLAIVGINAGAADGLAVTDGTIRGFKSNGITARNLALIENVKLTNNGGMGVRLDNRGRVLKNTISANASVGIFCNSKCLIEGNIITDSVTESGVGLFTGAGGHLVLGNVIVGNHLFGIYAEGPTGFGDNTLTGNNPGGALGGTQIVGGLIPLQPNACQPACP